MALLKALCWALVFLIKIFSLSNTWAQHTLLVEKKSMTSLRKKNCECLRMVLYATCLTFVIVALQAAGKIFSRRNIAFEQITNFNTLK